METHAGMGQARHLLPTPLNFWKIVIEKEGNLPNVNSKNENYI
jgi:hypothetical protein